MKVCWKSIRGQSIRVFIQGEGLAGGNKSSSLESYVVL